MARNAVQFQKGLSLSRFLEDYGTEQQCYDVLFKLRWPEGFLCNGCGHNGYCRLKARAVIQCYRCRKQTSLTAGTIFHATKLPLRIWFQALYLMSQDKKGISAMALRRQLGISYNAAWRMKQKLMQVMLERDNTRPLAGRIELDDAYLGGERSGGKVGRGAEGKTPFVAAVETTKEGHPVRIKLSRVVGFRSAEMKRWATDHLAPGSHVVSDGLACFNAVTEAGCTHEKRICGGGRASVEEPAFYWVNTVLGNLKSALRSTYHAVREKHAPRYLAEFQYRFNRRFDLTEFIPRLAYASVRTPPMPERLLTMAEFAW